MDTRKIILMSQLALYEKKYGKDDLKKTTFYRHDYVYLKSMWARFYAVLAGIILITIYCVILLSTIGLNDTIEYIQANYKNFAYFLIGIFLLYTVIGKVVYSKEYEKSTRRLESYARLLRKLDYDKQKKENVNKDDVER